MEKRVRDGKRGEGCQVEMRGGGSRVKELLPNHSRRKSAKEESKNRIGVSCFEKSLARSIFVRHGGNV